MVLKISQTVGFLTEGFDSEIPRQDKIKHLMQVFVASQYKNQVAV